MELNTIRQSDNEKITISIRLVGDVMPEDRHYMAVFNVLVRKCLGHLQLQLVGRDYYDAKEKVIEGYIFVFIKDLTTFGTNA